MSASPSSGAIDFHAHIVVPEIYAVAKRDSIFARSYEDPSLDASAREAAEARAQFVIQGMAETDKRLAQMDMMGVGRQVLSASLVHQCTYLFEARESLTLERMLNDRMAAIVADHPDLYSALGGVPLQSPHLAVEELRRCMALGLSGVGISTRVGMKEIGEAEFHPFWAEAEKLGAVVYIHPAGNHDPRFGKHFLWNSVGQSFEEAMAVASLMYEGVLERLSRAQGRHLAWRRLYALLPRSYRTQLYREGIDPRQHEAHASRIYRAALLR